MCLFQVDYTTHRRGEMVRLFHVFLRQTSSIMIDNKDIKDEGYLIVRKDVVLDLFVNCQPGVPAHWHLTQMQDAAEQSDLMRFLIFLHFLVLIYHNVGKHIWDAIWKHRKPVWFINVQDICEKIDGELVCVSMWVLWHMAEGTIRLESCGTEGVGHMEPTALNRHNTNLN